jgi:hypothetical protein
MAGAIIIASCTSSVSSGDSTLGTGDTSTTSGDGSVKVVSGEAIAVPPGAVAIEYFVATGDAPLLKETLVPLSGPTKTVAMTVNNITYAGVVCGFSFTGVDRPKPPIAFRMQIEQADGAVIDATVDVDWTGDVEKAGSTNVAGWNFLSDAQVNRNGPGWVVQVGAIPEGGGKDVATPTRALCTATAVSEMPVSAGPVAYWAGFATR